MGVRDGHQGRPTGPNRRLRGGGGGGSGKPPGGIGSSQIFGVRADKATLAGSLETPGASMAVSVSVHA